MKNFAFNAKADQHNKKAEASHFSGHFEEAIVHAEKARKLAPHMAKPYYWAAFSSLELHRLDDAYRFAQEGLAAHPGQPEIASMCARILAAMGKLEDARTMLRDCVASHPRCLEGWANYAIVLNKLGMHAEAKQASLKAIEIAPDHPAILANYANDLKNTGFAEDAIRVLQRAAAIAPTNKNIRSNLLFMLLFGEKTGAQDLLTEASRYAQMLARERLPKLAVQPRPRSDRIRIGILSNDLYRHACAYFLIPLIANLDRARFEVVALGLHAYHDNVTHKISIYCDRFVNLANKPDGEVVKLIREENIDVLIDLGGYTGTSPLHYMVHGLAPVQLTWLGYPGSTGMPAIQHRVTDWIGDPAGAEPNYTENLLRAPGPFAVYHPLVGNPLTVYQAEYQVRETPALRNGFITFGSCNNIGKLTDRTLRMWSAVLTRCPGSRLLVEAAGLDTDEVKVPLLERMQQAGIDTERVACILREGKNQYLTYHDIDIALDTSPVTGGTTTCDTLWMGVPVVSLAGPAFHTRVSAPFLHAVGLGGLVCETEEAYVEMAAQLAADVEQLNALRLSLRHRFEKSAIADVAGFTRWFEDQAAQLISQHRDVSHLKPRTQDGVFCNGAWHSMEELVLTIGLLLQEGRHIELNSLLENMSAKWSKHWLIAFALGEMAQREGRYDRALELLMEAVNLRPYHLPLYRLLSVRMREGGHDTSPVADILQQQFGLDLALIDSQGKPSTYEILGIQVLEEAA
ncbi:tetratricopeptide repeat protein [Cupriavidus basilensis]|nr:tetratricopeptide repeat protein [Cupriavidus basilensis]